MKAGVVIFPGSNCDHDLIEVLGAITKNTVEELWHKNTDLKGCSHIFLPGGFSYGDYLRSGAIAHLAPIMQPIKEHAANGGFVMGICNGFQILCESGMLPGALLRNTNMKFICRNVFLKSVSPQSSISNSLDPSLVLTVPIAHGEGRFFCDAQTLNSLENNKQVIFRYCNEQGEITDDSNPNGSVNNIAGISNTAGNVFGMMPHPERCSAEYLFNTDGLGIFKSIFAQRPEFV